MKYFFIILFQLAFFCAYSQSTDHLLAQASASGKKREKEKPSKKQKEETVVPVDMSMPAEKTQEEIDEENALRINQRWEKYLAERISEIQQLYNHIAQLDSNTLTKECLEEYHIEVNNLKEKVDFKLGNDPLWKENDALDEMRARFSETHVRTVRKLKYWEEKMTSEKKTNKLIVIGVVFLAIMAIVPVFSQIKSAISAKNAKKQTQKMMQQQQKEAEKRMLLADENNIINIK